MMVDCLGSEAPASKLLMVLSATFDRSERVGCVQSRRARAARNWAGVILARLVLITGSSVTYSGLYVHIGRLSSQIKPAGRYSLPASCPRNRKTGATCGSCAMNE